MTHQNIQLSECKDVSQEKGEPNDLLYILYFTVLHIISYYLSPQCRTVHS
jgi:hypothetical protein